MLAAVRVLPDGCGSHVAEKSVVLHGLTAVPLAARYGRAARATGSGSRGA